MPIIIYRAGPRALVAPCDYCAKPVQLNKWLFGSLHWCSTKGDTRQGLSDKMARAHRICLEVERAHAAAERAARVRRARRR